MRRRLQQIAVFLPNAMAHVDAAHIVDGEDAHGHAEIVERLSRLVGGRAFFDEELGLAHVREHHAIADEAAAIADHDADLAQFLCERQGRRDDVVAGFCSAHDLHQPHHVRRAEEMQADDRFGALGGAGDFIDIERGGVGGQDAMGAG